jgi:hypothetical protein
MAEKLKDLAPANDEDEDVGHNPPMIDAGGVVKEEADEEEEEDDDDDDEGDGDGEMLPEDFELRLREFARNPIPIRVRDVKIEGNYKTRASVIESQLDRLRDMETSQDLLREASYAVTRLERMGIFEECTLSLENGPVHGSVDVVVSVEERRNPCSFTVGSFIKPEVCCLWTFPFILASSSSSISGVR